MKITDLTANRLIWMDRGELIPLREINYRDVQVGDIFVKSPYGFGYIAIQITGKYLKGSRRPGGEGKNFYSMMFTISKMMRLC